MSKLNKLLALKKYFYQLCLYKIILKVNNKRKSSPQFSFPLPGLPYATLLSPVVTTGNHFPKIPP